MNWPFPKLESLTNESEIKKELTAWTVSTYYKKSIEEHEEYTKDGMTIIRKTGWRGGSWTVSTNDGNPPEFEFTEVPGGDGKTDSISIYDAYGNNIEEVELNETWDGCWEDIEWPEDIDDEERERLEALIEEEGFYALEEDGWYQGDSATYLWGPILIEDEAGNQVRIIVADENGNVIDFTE